MNKFENSFSSENKYKYFSDFRERADVFTFIEGFSTYVHDEKVKNIIFIDTSARPAWIGFDEYWKQNYREEKRPGIFFVNPDGFKEQKTLKNKEEDSGEVSFLDFLLNHQDSRRSFEDIQKEFQTKYPLLEKEKNESLLLFDTCSHTGKTILDVKNILERLSFKDIKVLTANIPDSDSGVQSEVSFEKYKFLTSCYPFGKDSLISRDETSVTSSANDLADRGMSMQIRKEIKNIIQERFENPTKIIT